MSKPTEAAIGRDKLEVGTNDDDNVGEGTVDF